MKHCIYTVITSTRYNLKDHKPPKGWDLICFTNLPLKAKYWDIRQVDKSPLDAHRLSRQFKILNDEYLPDYDLSVYLDSKFIVKHIDSIVKAHLGDHNIMMMSHKQRVCAYDEAKICSKLKLDDTGVIGQQIEKYSVEKFPRYHGLNAGGFIVRRHHIPEQEEFMKQWFYEVCHGSKRDQISFPYVLWKNPLKLKLLSWHKTYPLLMGRQ